jgi:hypothetical protein
MTPYKMMPLPRGEFLVEVDEGGDKPVSSGPYKSAAAARAYIEEHSRLARAGKPRTQKKV